MKILVVGGSYFFGRWFVEVAHKAHEVTVLNRGNIPVNVPGKDPMVRELICDRQDADALAALADEEFDAIVDFCAYHPGDIEKIAKKFHKKNMRYIFISTVDVYRRENPEHTSFATADKENPQAAQRIEVSEDAPLEDRVLPGEEGAYIRGKVILEQELKDVSKKWGLIGISVRPGIIYGPANYAPREKLFMDWIDQAGQVILPLDSDGHFQFIYVVDAAKALLCLCEKAPDTLKNAYNFVNPKSETYDSFARELHRVSKKDFQEIRIPVKEIVEKNIPLPYPLTAEESRVYRWDLLESLGVELTPFDLGKTRR